MPEIVQQLAAYNVRVPRTYVPDHEIHISLVAYVMSPTYELF